MVEDLVELIDVHSAPFSKGHCCSFHSGDNVHGTDMSITSRDDPIKLDHDTTLLQSDDLPFAAQGPAISHGCCQAEEVGPQTFHLLVVIQHQVNLCAIGLHKSSTALSNLGNIQSASIPNLYSTWLLLHVKHASITRSHVAGGPTVS